VQGYVYIPTNSPSIVSLLCNKFRSRLSEELTVSMNTNLTQYPPSPKEFPKVEINTVICDFMVRYYNSLCAVAALIA
jgi:hypothetical protein